MSVFGQLAEAKATSPAGFGRIAECILSNPEESVSSTIADLAARSGTSPATINRFCKALGYSGYSAMRVAVATANGRAEQSQWSQAVGSEVEPGDSLDAVAKIIAADSLRAIQETLERIDITPLAGIVSAISQAPKIHLFGMSGSYLPANELRHRLQTIGLSAWALADLHDGLTSAAMSKPGDVFVVFSHSGRTTESLQVITEAANSGATTIAITNHADSPIALAAEFSMMTVVDDGLISRSQALAARHSLLFLVDLIFVSVANDDYTRALQAFDQANKSVIPRLVGDNAGRKNGSGPEFAKRVGP